MTPEEMREMIENMLRVQSELQKNQLSHQDEIKNMLAVQAELQQS